MSFNDPLLISKELQEFTGWKDNRSTLIDISHFIIEYIKSHMLSGDIWKIFYVDNRIAKLFNIEQPTLSYSDLQTHLKYHVFFIEKNIRKIVKIQRWCRKVIKSNYLKSNEFREFFYAPNGFGGYKSKLRSLKIMNEIK